MNFLWIPQIVIIYRVIWHILAHPHRNVHSPADLSVDVHA